MQADHIMKHYGYQHKGALLFPTSQSKDEKTDSMLHLTLGHAALAVWCETTFVTHWPKLPGCIFQASSGVGESGAWALCFAHNTDLKTAGSCFTTILLAYLQASEYLFYLILDKSLMYQDN